MVNWVRPRNLFEAHADVTLEGLPASYSVISDADPDGVWKFYDTREQPLDPETRFSLASLGSLAANIYGDDPAQVPREAIDGYVAQGLEHVPNDTVVATHLAYGYFHGPEALAPPHPSSVGS